MLRTNPQNILAFVHDLVAVAVAWVLAYFLRFNFDVPANFSAGMLAALWWLVPLHAAVAWRTGLYRGVWRYASLMDLKRIVFAVGLSSLIAAAIVFLASLQSGVPRSLLILHPLLLVMIMSGSRVTYRIFKEYRLYGHANLRGEPVIVLGAGDAAVDLLRELWRSPQWHVVGLLDDDHAKRGREIYGVKVLGAIDELPLWAKKFTLRNVILALPAATASRRRHAIEVAGGAQLTVLTVPAFAELLSGRLSISQIRLVELEDLLGREEVALDDKGLHELLTARRIMVTGAGGSIGSELCRQIAAYQPQLLVLFELNEYALYRIEDEFRRNHPDLSVMALIGDVKDYERVLSVMLKTRPEVVFHAAAFKHVPLMESLNAWEAIANNVLGTQRVSAAAVAAGVDKLVFISTDKAVKPTSVMGASKRLAERVCKATQQGIGTRFVIVRFGNVLGSAGSVIPKFREQIARGGPLTVTHPDINRYFMTIPEAAQLVLQAGLMGEGGEIFVLDMGEPVRIADLARDMIRLSGFSEDEIGIVYTGLRPGEKLYEELLADNEYTLPTPHVKLRVAASEEEPSADWLSDLCEDIESLRFADVALIKQHLKRQVPEYTPSS